MSASRSRSSQLPWVRPSASAYWFTRRRASFRKNKECATSSFRFVILSEASAPLFLRRNFCGGRTRSRKTCGFGEAYGSRKQQASPRGLKPLVRDDTLRNCEPQRRDHPNKRKGAVLTPEVTLHLPQRVKPSHSANSECTPKRRAPPNRHRGEFQSVPTALRHRADLPRIFSMRLSRSVSAVVVVLLVATSFVLAKSKDDPTQVSSTDFVVLKDD